MFSNTQNATQKPVEITPPRPIAMVGIITDMSKIRGAEDVVGKVVHLSWKTPAGIEGGNHLVKSIVSVGGESFLSVQRIRCQSEQQVYFHVLKSEQRLIPVREVSFKVADWYPAPGPSNQGAIYSEQGVHSYAEQCARQRDQEASKMTRRDWWLLTGVLLSPIPICAGLVGALTSVSSRRPPASKRSLNDLKLPERPRRE